MERFLINFKTKQFMADKKFYNMSLDERWKYLGKMGVDTSLREMFGKVPDHVLVFHLSNAVAHGFLSIYSTNLTNYDSVSAHHVFYNLLGIVKRMPSNLGISIYNIDELLYNVRNIASYILSVYVLDKSFELINDPTPAFQTKYHYMEEYVGKKLDNVSTR